MNVDNFVAKFSGQTEEYKFYKGEVILRYDVENHEYLRLEGNEFIPVPGVTTVCHIIDKSQALLPWACKMMAEKLLKTTPKDFESVNDILEPQVKLSWSQFESLVLASKSAHKEKLEEAADVGKIAHNWIEQYIKLALGNPLVNWEMPLLPENEKSASCCRAALDWMGKHKVKWVATETKVYSRAYDFAGTLDGLAYVSSCDNLLCCSQTFENRLSIVDWKSSNYLYKEYLLQTAAYQEAYMEEQKIYIADRWVIRLGKENGEFEPWHLEAPEFVTDFAAFKTALDLCNVIDKIETRMKIRKNFIKEEKKKAKKAKKEFDKMA
jgi:hypothetical protein